MEIQVERGTGYVPSEKDNKEKSDIGSIPLDAIFTPVKRVSFKVENMRVGKRTDFDRLFLEIETDGTITPEEAVLEASEILVNHFALIVDEFKTEELKSEDTVEEPKVKKTVKADKKDSKSKSKKNEKKSKNKKI
jgi:DNA-directed RNA polymerase subunit alpha